MASIVSTVKNAEDQAQGMASGMSWRSERIAITTSGTLLMSDIAEL